MFKSSQIGTTSAHIVVDAVLEEDRTLAELCIRDAGRKTGKRYASEEHGWRTYLLERNQGTRCLSTSSTASELLTATRGSKLTSRPSQAVRLSKYESAKWPEKGTMAAQDDHRSYMSKLNPWSNSPSIPPSRGKEGEPPPAPLREQKGADHAISHKHRLSLRHYPKDCPRLRPQWFHAVDIPRRRPNPAGETTEEKPAGTPKK